MRTIIRAFSVALVVGSILMVINQYEALFGAESIRILPAILTYCVPFCVFLLGQWSAARQQARTPD